MRALFFGPGGTVHERRFLEKLADSKHEILFLALPGAEDGRCLPGVSRLTWPEGVKPGRSPKEWEMLVPAFREILARVCPDLVHAGPLPSCGFVTARAGFHPWIAVSWGRDVLFDAERDAEWRHSVMTALDSSDMLLCDCRAVRDRVFEMVRYPDDRLVELPWGVDLGVFRPGPARAFGKGRPGWEDAIVALCTRALEPIYGIDILLEAFRQAAGDEPRLRLVLAGDGSFAPKVDQFLDEHALRERVERIGPIREDALADLFRSADLYVSTSHVDGSSVSLLEALATGLPAVVTDLPANREWLTQGENGWLARDGDAEAFARALAEAASLTVESRHVMAEKNRRLAQARADWHANFPRLLAAWERLPSLSARGARRAERRSP
jgi:glycosyltransferase involved in cell wall biosynthesis